MSTRIPPTLRELLASRGLNMISAGVLAGVDTATISRICSGQARATPQTVVRLARALGVNARRMARLCDQAWRDREQRISEVTPPVLANLLATHTYTYKTKASDAGGGTEEVMPPTAVLAAALAPKEWRRLRPLFGIVGAQVLRPDGSLLQQPGYDEATGLYFARKVPLDGVLEAPTTAGSRRRAGSCLMSSLVTSRGRARPIKPTTWDCWQPRSCAATCGPDPVRSGQLDYARLGQDDPDLRPGHAVRPAEPDLAGQRRAELRKAIASVLADPVGAIIFDNLAEGTVIDSPVLARLITDRTWADRLLGGNPTAAFANDRVWTATGNNLRLGGDIRTRSSWSVSARTRPQPRNGPGWRSPT